MSGQSRHFDRIDRIDPPKDLTLPLPASNTARRVLSLAVRRLLFDLKDIALRSAPWLGQEALAFQSLIVQSLKNAPGALSSALRLPSIGALLRCLRKPSPLSRAWCTELFALLCLELSRLEALPTPIVLHQFPRRLLCLGGSFVLVPPPHSQSLRFENACPPGGPDCMEFLYHAIEKCMVLALEDNNPLAMLEAHPNKSGNSIDLGGHSVQEWTAALRDALALIKRYLPDLRNEMDLFVHQFIPVGFDNEKHLSASYQEAIGTIYLSLHPNPMTMAEALIHEFSHNKINALFELDDVLENAWSPLYASPVRPDPRPLHGIVLAAHAFLPVAALYRAMLEAGDPLSAHPSFRERFHKIIAVNHEAVSTILEHGRPTPVGAGLLDEFSRLDQYDQKCL